MSTAIHPEAGQPFYNPDLPPELLAGFVVGECGHRVAESEWRAGLRSCERCPRQAGTTDATPSVGDALDEGRSVAIAALAEHLGVTVERVLGLADEHATRHGTESTYADVQRGLPYEWLQPDTARWIIDETPAK